MNREEGYYWIKYDEGANWSVRQFLSGRWMETLDHYASKDIFFKIGPKIEPPKEEKPITGNETIHSMESFAKSLANKPATLQKSVMDAATFLTFDDRTFEGYYVCGWIEIHGSTDQIKEIDKRATKLGLK